MSTANIHSFIVDTLVTNADDLFPGGKNQLLLGLSKKVDFGGA